jgi:tRNA(Ile)-lysidine synthase
LAISGGLDSIAMAAVFRALNWPCEWAHVNFGLRGAESDGDETFVRELANQWGVKLQVRRCETKVFAQQNGLSTQEAARHLRYAFFQELLEQKPGLLLATAHHADDNFEHFFLYLMRGSTATAFRGLPFENGSVIRPLWPVTRAEIQEFALEQDLDWREDSSNASDHYSRNRIRHILKEFETVNPDSWKNVRKEFSQLAERAQQAEANHQRDWEQRWGEDWRERAQGPGLFMVELPDARSLERLGFNKAQVGEMGRAERSGARWMGRGIWNLERTQSGWLLAGPDLESLPTVSLEVGSTIEWGSYRFSLNQEPYSGQENAWCFSGQQPLFIRAWEQGDRMTAWGLSGQKKVSDWLGESGVPRRLRSQVPVLCDERGIVGLVDIRRSSLRPAQVGESCLVLRWHRLTTFV